MPLTLLRSSGGSSSRGTPRTAACSNAKFGAAEKVPPVSPGLRASSRIQRPGRRTNAAGVIKVKLWPSTDASSTVIRPMSWKNGSQLTPRSPSCPSRALSTCTTLVGRFRWVICTPLGMRVEPDVYCKYATVSSLASGCCQVAATSVGTASTAMTRGRSLADRARMNLRTPSAESVVVRIVDGAQSSSTACNRPTCPGSAGSNNGTAMRPE
ncbi:Uncharacterised protein [Mycobacterium tuberculosis]|nr:Uncharacterised protein [Mycobacterium tuberculosis]